MILAALVYDMCSDINNNLIQRLKFILKHLKNVGLLERVIFVLVAAFAAAPLLDIVYN